MPDVTYRTSGAWGSGKGANLTPAEVDNSFYSVVVRLNSLESSPPLPSEISNIEQVGSQLFIYLTDSTSFGPFTLPNAVAQATVATIAAASKTLALTDIGRYNRCTNAGGCVVDIPADDEVAFAQGSEVHFVGTRNIVYITAGTDVIINPPSGYLQQTSLPGAVITLKKVGTNEWDLFGLLATEAGSGEGA